jgi:hypothetical protein
MKGLGTSVYSHITLDTGVRTSNSEVRSSNPKSIRSYPELVRAVARIQFGNPEYSLFFRGQDKDYAIPSGSSSMYPSIYRSPNDISLSVDKLEERMTKLTFAQEVLLEEFRVRNLVGSVRLSDFKELCWAILQHYEVCDTPFLDITSSLQAAASFALRHKTSTGILYVLGFPHVNGSISYYVEEALINIKLLSICPPDAQRPYFQEGYLVGTFPTTVRKKQPYLDVAARIIAKFRLTWGTDDFWKEEASAIPDRALLPEEDNALFPEDDIVKIICKEIKDKLDSLPKDYWQKKASPEQSIEGEMPVT